MISVRQVLPVLIGASAMLHAHTVTWKPNPMVLSKGGSPGMITIAPDEGELCIVTGSVKLSTGNSPNLISVTNPGASVTLFLAVQVLREPNGTESNDIDGEWHATGVGGAGCNGNGTYHIPVKVVPSAPAAPPTAGNTPGGESTDDPIWTKTGEVTQIDRDLDLRGPLRLSFLRYYASLLAANGVSSALGNNWMHNFDVKLIVSGSNATVRLFRGQTVAFQQSGGGWQLANAERANYQLVNAGGGFQFLDAQQNHVYTFSSSGALTRIEDRSGNALTVTPGPSGPISVSDGLGRTLTFAYTGANLASVADQTGRRVSFTYTGNDLTSFTDANGNTSLYTYTTAGSQVGLLVTRTLPAGNKPFTQSFDSSGRAIRQVDSFGNATALAYDTPSPGATTITDPLAMATRHTYQGAGNLAGNADAAGQSATFTYDNASRRTSMTDRMGDTTSVTYHNPSGYVATYTDALGAATTYSYISQTQGPLTYYLLSKIAYPDGTSAGMSYDSKGNLVTLTDQAGKNSTFTYNTRGQVITSTNQAGGVTTYTYGADGTLASVQYPSGDMLQYAYDQQKRLRQITFGDGTTQSYEFDALDNLTKVTDERGKSNTFAYEVNGNIKTVADAFGAAAQFAYDADERLTAVRDPLGGTQTFHYDAAGRLNALTNAAGETVTNTRDPNGNVTSITDPAGKTDRYSWDKEEVLVTAANPLSQTTTYDSDKMGQTTRMTTPQTEVFTQTFDKMGRLVTLVDPLGHKGNYSYDSRGSITGVSLPAGISASFARGDLGEISAITGPNGNVWKQSYDNMGRVTTRTDPLGRSTAYTYDARGRGSVVTTPVGKVVFSYDKAGHPSRLLYADGTDLNYGYDDNGSLISANNLTLAYDANGDIVSSNGVATGRDAVGRITSTTYGPGLTVTYTRNSQGLVTAVTDWVGGSTALTYDDARRVSSITLPNGATTEYSYDKNGRISGITESQGGAPLSNIALVRDGVGNVLSANRDVPQAPDPAPGALSLAYDAAEQISGATYDGVGRLTAGGMRTYTWDGASRLLSYAGADGAASFTYDGFGQRVSRTTAAGGTENYVVNYATGLPSMAAVQGADGSPLRYYVYLPGGRLLYGIEAGDSSRHFYHYDETGSTLFLTDDSGAITDTYGMTPFGETITATGSTPNPFTYLGAFGVTQEGSTGLFYMRARYYDSASARFLSRDPIRSLSPQRINPYQYARENPLRNADPLGTIDLEIGGVRLNDVHFYDNGIGGWTDDGTGVYVSKNWRRPARKPRPKKCAPAEQGPRLCSTPAGVAVYNEVHYAVSRPDPPIKIDYIPGLPDPPIRVDYIPGLPDPPIKVDYAVSPPDPPRSSPPPPGAPPKPPGPPLGANPGGRKTTGSRAATAPGADLFPPMSGADYVRSLWPRVTPLPDNNKCYSYDDWKQKLTTAVCDPYDPNFFQPDPGPVPDINNLPVPDGGAKGAGTGVVMGWG